MNTPAKLPGIGVIVGRFQVHKLTPGHMDLFEDVFARHEQILVFLGTSPIKASRQNPLPFKPRKMMISSAFRPMAGDDNPILKILEIKDVHNEELWSKHLDDAIDKHNPYPATPATLYGSRDGFIPYYKGKFNTVELAARRVVSGSEIRNNIKDEILDSEIWRQAFIAACYDRYPTSYTTVDAVILDRKEQPTQKAILNGLPLGHGIKILLGRKENETAWRMIGGFVDINLDDSCEEAVKRESMEETGLRGVGEPTYIGSAKIDDWRYRNEQDGIMTIIYEINNFVGTPKASDDIAELKWFELDLVLENKVPIVHEHGVIIEKVRKHLQKERK